MANQASKEAKSNAGDIASQVTKSLMKVKNKPSIPKPKAPPTTSQKIGNSINGGIKEIGNDVKGLAKSYGAINADYKATKVAKASKSNMIKNQIKDNNSLSGPSNLNKATKVVGTGLVGVGASNIMSKPKTNANTSTANPIKDAQRTYNVAKINGDKKGMAQAHAKAENYRITKLGRQVS